MVWRLEARADAQIAVLQAMTKELHGIKTEQQEQRRAFTRPGIHVRAAAGSGGRRVTPRSDIELCRYGILALVALHTVCSSGCAHAPR
jgi:hypothetical protein